MGTRLGHASVNMVHSCSVLLLLKYFYFHSAFYSSKNNFLILSTGSIGGLFWTILKPFSKWFCHGFSFPKHYHFYKFDQLYLFYLVSNNIYIVKCIKCTHLKHIVSIFMYVYIWIITIKIKLEYFLYPTRFSCALFILTIEGLISFLTSGNSF